MVTVDEFAAQLTASVARMRKTANKDRRPGWTRVDDAFRAMESVIDTALLRAQAAEDGATPEAQMAIVAPIPSAPTTSTIGIRRVVVRAASISAAIAANDAR